MKTQTEYRNLASDCVRLARIATTPQVRLTLLDIAGIWLTLSDRLNDRQAGKLENPAKRVA